MTDPCLVCGIPRDDPGHPRCHCGMDDLIIRHIDGIRFEETVRCIGGVVRSLCYSPCPNPDCVGFCLYEDDCHCGCHQQAAVTASPEVRAAPTRQAS